MSKIKCIKILQQEISLSQEIKIVLDEHYNQIKILFKLSLNKFGKLNSDITFAAV